MPFRLEKIYSPTLHTQSIEEELSILLGLLDLHPNDETLRRIVRKRLVQSTDSIILDENKPNEEKEKDYLTDLNDQIEVIDKELKDYYNTDFYNYTSSDPNTYFYRYPPLIISSPRFAFLLQKRHELQKHRNPLNSKLISSSNPISSDKQPSLIITILNILKKPFDVGKKFIDVIDDAWTATGRIALPQETVQRTTPFLTGPIGLFVHLVEGVNGGWIALKALRKKNTSRRKTKIVTGGLSFALGGVGIGLAASLIAGGAGMIVAGFALMPMLIPTFLTAIYGLALFRRSHKLHDMKKNEASAAADYIQYRDQHSQQINDLKSEIKEITYKKKLLAEEATWYVSKIKENKVLEINHANLNTYASKLNACYAEIATLSSEQLQKDHQLTQYQSALDERELKYKRLHDKRLQTERDVAFTTLEILISTIVVTGSILGIAALVGVATIVSLGMAPTALAIVGVTLGVGLKIFQWRDKKNDHSYTIGMRRWFTSTWNSYFPSDPKHTNKKIGNDHPNPALSEAESVAHALSHPTQPIPIPGPSTMTMILAMRNTPKSHAMTLPPLEYSPSPSIIMPTHALSAPISMPTQTKIHESSADSTISHIPSI